MTTKKKPKVEVKQECRREGCTKQVPPAARKHGDPFCSSICFKVHNGYMDEAEAGKQRRASAGALKGGGPDAWRKHQTIGFTQRGRR